jgi:UDP-sulfoquinovose synthase
VAKKIFVLGGDGFCGWPTALHLSELGHEVVIIDNLSRRRIDAELGVHSLTPIAMVDQRLDAWHQVSGRTIRFHYLDVAQDYARLLALLAEERPDVIVHFAEQRAAPYSMRGPTEKRYTVNNNVGGTHNVLTALVACDLDAHLVHLGTMGVYGYGGAGFEIPEGYLTVQIHDDAGAPHDWEILYPTRPGSVYHMTKSIDQLLFQFYAQNDRLRITDLHQGIVWGTNTEATDRDPRLTNRFDYDGDYGTVLNRFLMQAAIGYPLTVHGTGGQTRAFIHIRDSVKCVQLALENPPTRGERVKIFNQMTESHQVGELAKKVAGLTGAQINHLPNPRNEAVENDLIVDNRCFIELGLKPTTLDDGLLAEVVDVARRWADRCDRSRIPCVSAWTQAQAQAIQTA